MSAAETTAAASLGPCSITAFASLSRAASGLRGRLGDGERWEVVGKGRAAMAEDSKLARRPSSSCFVPAASADSIAAVDSCPSGPMRDAAVFARGLTLLLATEPCSDDRLAAPEGCTPAV